MVSFLDCWNSANVVDSAMRFVLDSCLKMCFCAAAMKSRVYFEDIQLVHMHPSL